MKALLKHYRQSPRKVRLVADAIRGKSAESALVMLRVINKRASGAVEKALRSALANAKENFNKTEKELFIKEIRVDEGATLKRHMPRAFGRATPINKRTSRIAVVLAEQELAGDRQMTTNNKENTKEKAEKKNEKTEEVKKEKPAKKEKTKEVSKNTKS